jgi:predicted transcriptional regulator
MNIHVGKDLAKKLHDLAAASGRKADDLLHDALTGYLDEVNALRERLDRRYDEIASGKVRPMDGPEVIRDLRAKSSARRRSAV